MVNQMSGVSNMNLPLRSNVPNQVSLYILYVCHSCTLVKAAPCDGVQSVIPTVGRTYRVLVARKSLLFLKKNNKLMVFVLNQV